MWDRLRPEVTLPHAASGCQDDNPVLQSRGSSGPPSRRQSTDPPRPAQVWSDELGNPHVCPLTSRQWARGGGQARRGSDAASTPPASVGQGSIWPMVTAPLTPQSWRNPREGRGRYFNLNTCTDAGEHGTTAKTQELSGSQAVGSILAPEGAEGGLLPTAESTPARGRQPHQATCSAPQLTHSLRPPSGDATWPAPRSTCLTGGDAGRCCYF